MNEDPISAEEWVTREDLLCKQERIERLEWLIEKYPIGSDGVLFPGGILTKQLFEEARYCFIYAQFLASIFLSLAFIERVLAALLFGAGRDDFKKSGIAELSKEARRVGFLSEDEFQAIDKLRQRRNPLTHFREPGHKETVEFRSVQTIYDEVEFPMSPEEIIANDSVMALNLVLHLLGRLCTPIGFEQAMLLFRLR